MKKIKEKVFRECGGFRERKRALIKAIDIVLAEVGKVIDDVDLELFFTDIKDKEGKKFELSDEFMEIISIWWNKQSVELKTKLGIK